MFKEIVKMNSQCSYELFARCNIEKKLQLSKTAEFLDGKSANEPIIKLFEKFEFSNPDFWKSI